MAGDDFRDVLIVDDEKDICELLKIYCENLGVFRNILIARDGVSASNKLHNQKFSLILLDINMPKKNGIDVLKEFDSHNPNNINQIVIVSGELNKQLLPQILKKGVKNFLIKPFDEAQFQAKVLEVLKQTVARTKAV